MNPDLEMQLRKLTLPQLGILKILATSSEAVSSNKEISSTIHSASYELGAFLGALRKVRVDGKSLILPAGRDVDKGTRWQINERVVDKADLKTFLVNIGI